MLTMTQNTKALILLSLAVAVINMFYPPTNSEAGGLDFGGKIVSITPCTCGVGSQVFISGGASTGTYLYTPATRNYGLPLKPSRNALGTYIPGGVCLVGTGSPCATLPITKGTMRTVKSS